MDKAERWQDRVEEEFRGEHGTILNPRRDKWDIAGQAAGDPEFARQVHWELDALREADAVLFYFQPGTKSPISLLELGLVATDHKGRGAVYCPAGYWRKGNVDIVCDRFGMFRASNWEDLYGFARRRLGLAK